MVRRLVQSNEQSARDWLRGMPDTLQGGALESHVSIAANAYAMMKEKAKSDSLHQVIREKFPLGVAARNDSEKKV